MSDAVKTIRLPNIWDELSGKMRRLNAYEWAFLIVLIVQLSVLIYFNLFTLKEHMGYDTSWIYLKSFLIWKEKALTSANWVEQTSPFLDSAMLLAALLDRKSTRLNSSHTTISYAVFCLKKKKK